MRVIQPGEHLQGSRVTLRLCELADCNDAYVAWLDDPEVNRYLETRWTPQTLASVRDFVATMLASQDSYLFAIIDTALGRHVGNVKVGPVREHHAYADISYFIGERSAWGRGLGTDAVRTATAFGFERLGLQRLQAGLYETNIGSSRVLEKAGYVQEGRLRKQLLGRDGREDHVWFGALREEWR